jgi:hypothetical protein
MSWEIGYDNDLNRDVGYGVPAYCDQPGCTAEIDRGLGHICGGEPFGGEHGCGLHFCTHHLADPHQLCHRCRQGLPHFALKPDHPKWMHWKLTDSSWQEWRNKNPEAVAALTAALAEKGQQ